MVFNPPNPGPGSDPVDSGNAVAGLKQVYADLMKATLGEGWNGKVDDDIRNTISASIMMIIDKNGGRISVPSSNGVAGITYKVSDNGQLNRVKDDGSVEEKPEANDIYNSPHVAYALTRQALTIKANTLAEQLRTDDAKDRATKIRAAQEKVAELFSKSPQETKEILSRIKNSSNYDAAIVSLKPMVGDSQRSDDLITYLMFLDRMERSASNNPANRDVTGELRANTGLQKFAAVTDIIGGQATGTKPDPAINGVDGKPASQNLPDVDFRLFDKRVYDIMSKAYINDQGQMAFPNIPGELVGPEHAGTFLTHKQIALIAQERLDQRLHDLGIPPHRLTEALFDKNSPLAVTPHDLRLVLYGMGEGNISSAHHTAFNQKYGYLGAVPDVTTYIRSGHYMATDYNVEEREINGAGILKRLQERQSLQGLSTDHLNRTFSAAEYFDLEDHGDGKQNFMGDLMAKNALNYDRTKRMAAGIIDGDPARIVEDAQNKPNADKEPKKTPEDKKAEIRACGAEMTCTPVKFKMDENGEPVITFPSGVKINTAPLVGTP